MVVIGRRVSDHNTDKPPRVSIYRGPNVPAAQRAPHMRALFEGRKLPSLSIESFAASITTHALGSGPWSDVILTSAQVKARRAMREAPQVEDLRVEEGVIVTPGRMRASHEQRMSAYDVARAGGHGANRGIFVLKSTEREALGPLSQAEQAAIRPQINTVHVFPYAVVMPDDADVMIYLPRPADPGIGSGLTDDMARQRPFPENMPNLEAHLAPFRELMRSIVEGYGERRPWWSAHRDRPDIFNTPPLSQAWSDYCVTTRWGNGGQLIVGLAPAGALPGSALHAIRAVGSPGTAAYLAALFNSTAFQEMAETLPPGQVRAAEIKALGIPLPSPSALGRLTSLATAQADRVTRLVGRHALRFPLLRNELRADSALLALDTNAWIAKPGPAWQWGTLSSVAWAQDRQASSLPARPISRVAIDNGLFGNSLTVESATVGPSGRLVFHLPMTATDDDIDSLSAYLKGLAASGVKLNAVLAQPAPVNLSELPAAYQSDLRSLHGDLDAYQRSRAEMEGLLFGSN